MNNESIYGLTAEFESESRLLWAAERSYEYGYRQLDGYTPFPVEGLAEALGRKTRLPLWVLLSGIIGGVSAYFMQWFAGVVSYPINVGGRPLHSWPSFIPITFELTVLGASLTAFFFSMGLSGLPRLYHPMFNLPEFERASQDRFFLCIKATDSLFEPEATRRFLSDFEPVKVTEVFK